MADIENLQLLLYDANIRKSNKINKIPNKIKTYLKENKCDF